MYETFMHTLRLFFGVGIMRNCLVAALAVIVVVLAAGLSPACRASWSAFRARGAWRAGLAAVGAGVFKFLAIFFLARLMIIFAVYQSSLFQQRHGRVTDRNRSAVLMKWGAPHEQHELGVSHTRKRTWVTRQLQLETLRDGKREEKLYAESFWKDDAPPVQAVKGVMPAVLSTREEERDVPVDQRSIVAANVCVEVTNNRFSDRPVSAP